MAVLINDQYICKPSSNMLKEEEKIIALLNDDDERAVDMLFDKYYGYLCNVVYRVINDAEFAEDIVQEIFTDIWHKRNRLNIHSSLRAYLRIAAINRSLNHIRKNKFIVDEAEGTIAHLESTQITGQGSMEKDELEARINNCIDSLPPKCRLVFTMSRYEAMTYAEIATSLDISIKTVENQISKALKLLREAVEPYLV